MLEIVFGDSAKGAVQAARLYNPQAQRAGAIGYIGRKPDDQERAVDLGAGRFL